MCDFGDVVCATGSASAKTLLSVQHNLALLMAHIGAIWDNNRIGISYYLMLDEFALRNKKTKKVVNQHSLSSSPIDGWWP